MFNLCAHKIVQVLYQSCFRAEELDISIESNSDFSEEPSDEDDDTDRLLQVSEGSPSSTQRSYRQFPTREDLLQSISDATEIPRDYSPVKVAKFPSVDIDEDEWEDDDDAGYILAPISVDDFLNMEQARLIFSFKILFQTYS